MRTKLPETPARFAEEHPAIWKCFEQLANHCHQAGPLDARNRRLVKLGVALGAGLEGGFHAQVRNALAEGIRPAEIRHAVLLSLTTIGFPATMAALTWVDDVLKRKRRAKRKQK
jgi:alkylhydroperoxidase/carboxymuconolactone decarboxylase family protein YurZ